MATLIDIAKAAGVSSMTVSRVLNGEATYRRPQFAQRAERIKALAVEMGYRPNASAMAIRSGRFDTVALLLSQDRTCSLLPDYLLGGIQQALGERDLNLSVGAFSDSVLTSPNDVPKLLRQLSSDGLLINYNARIPQAMIRLITSYCLPSVWINSRQAHDAVYPDDLGAARLATQKLLELGHRRIAYADYTSRDPAESHYSVIDRHQGCREVTGSAGLSLQRLGDRGTYEAGRIVQHARAVLQNQDRPTAVVCYGSTEAYAMIAAAMSLGLSVPGDLSVVTFGDKVLMDLGPAITMFELPQFQIGQVAVELLSEKLADATCESPSRAVPLTYRPGQTIARTK